MRKLVLILILVSTAALVFAQDTQLETGAAAFVEAFNEALRDKNLSSFIEDNILPDSELRSLVEKQNAEMGLSEDDPNRLTMKQAIASIEKMKKSFSGSFHYGLDALKIIEGIKAEDLTVKDYRAQKSYWEPPVVKIAMLAVAGTKEITINVSNLSITNSRPVLGPSSRIEFRGYQAQDVIAHYTIEALKRRDAEYFADNVLADAEGLQKLINANTESAGALAEMNIEELYNHTRDRVVEDFTTLLETGNNKGVDWSNIEKTWSGYTASLQGQLYQTSIPIQFQSGGTEYRIVLDFCQQLASDKSVFLPGEFKWEGRM